MAGLKTGEMDPNRIDHLATAFNWIQLLNEDPSQAMHEDLSGLILVLIPIELIAKDDQIMLSEAV